MADIQLTDDLGKSVPDVQIDLSHPSSLLKYAKTELLHLVVAPDFIKLASQSLTAAAPNPISFLLKLEHTFQLGNTGPEINLTPSFQAIIRANTTQGSNLFETDPFGVASTVPDQTGYVSLAVKGSLDLGVSGSSGDLTFGFDANRTIELEYWKAFPFGAGKPTLGEATGKTISGYVIPADVDDLKLLGVNDVCTVSGQGSLKISGGFKVSAAPNPLASVDLPLKTGKIEVKTGVMAGISASFTITGSYQVRVRRTSKDTIELSFYKQKGTTLMTDLSASGGVSVNFGDTDLLESLLGAISTDPNDDATKKLFEDGGLSKDEIATLTGAIKDSLDHSLQTSLDLALSQLTDDEAAFQYEIQPALLDVAASAALHKALEGDLSGLTGFEKGAEGAVLASGVKLLSSVLTTVRKNQIVLKLNLLGLVNFISVSDLIRKCVVVKDPSTGYLTIADSVTGGRINAVVEPQRRREALRKAVFESLMLTATYRVSNTINMPGLTSHNFHFAFNDTTKAAVLAHYLNWFVVMNLLTQQQKENYLKQFPGGGPSTCLIRTEFDSNACQSLFFKSPNQLWDVTHYLELGRQAMRALIDPDNSDIDRYRCALLEDHWPEAVQIGPNDSLASLVGLHLTDSTGRMITPFLRGDVYTIDWWAKAMVEAGTAIVAMQQFLAGADPATLADSHEFSKRRDQLQKKMAGMIGNSPARFDEPWGLVSLFWAAGSRGASGRVVANGLLLQKPDQSPTGGT
jgi:hypothetical protein